MQRHRAPSARRLTTNIRSMAALCVLLVVAAAGCRSPFGSGGPTPTPGPPTATPTTEQRIAALARHAVGPNVQHVDATYSAADGSVTVTVTLGGSVPVADADVSAMQERVKGICFQAQKALWASGMPLHNVTTTIVGPVQDLYGDRAMQPYAAAVVAAATAAKLNWATLTPDVAWDKYDNTYLRPIYYDVG